MMLVLPLIDYKDRLKTRHHEGRIELWAFLRRKYIVLQPEEMVRQLLIHYLIDRGYPPGRMTVERGVEVYGRHRRYDLVVLKQDLTPFMVVECKAHAVPINQKTLDQAALYNQELAADYMLVTNGQQAICAAVDQQRRSFELVSLPSYPKGNP